MASCLVILFGVFLLISGLDRTFGWFSILLGAFFLPLELNKSYREWFNTALFLVVPPIIMIVGLVFFIAAISGRRD